jgi:hypothetical protein
MLDLAGTGWLARGHIRSGAVPIEIDAGAAGGALKRWPVPCESPLRTSTRHAWPRRPSRGYIPFDSTDLARLGKVDDTGLIDRLKDRELAAVQICCFVLALKRDDDPNIIRQNPPIIEGS